MPAASASFVERELNYFRSATAFREISTIAAMDLCRQEGIPPPEWLLVEATELLFTLAKSQKVTKLGRAGGYIAEYKRHINNLDRWDAVQRVREHRSKAERELEIEHQYPGVALSAKGIVEHFKGLKRWLLRYKTDQCAALLVAHSGGTRVSAAAIRRSYRIIEKKNAAEGFKSCVFSPDFLQRLGIGETKRPGRKWRPFTALTP